MTSLRCSSSPKKASYWTARLSLAAALSLCGCAEPPLGMHDVDVIGYDGQQAIPPDCSKLVEKSVYYTATKHPRPTMAWGCATYTNLAAQIVRPADLVAPHPLSPADAAVAASAVSRYQRGDVMKLQDNSLKAGS
jgi:hypothetical protein